MPNKQFADKLNKELDGIDVPSLTQERVDVLAKLLKIPRFKAEAILNGLALPDDELLNRLADELEINKEWLLGKSDNRLKKERKT